MNPLGGLMKLTAAVVIAWLWARGSLTPVLLDTIGAFTNPRQPSGTAGTSTSTSSSTLTGGTTA